jgi:hypothetical protein
MVNIIIQYSPRPIPHVHIADNESNARENASSRIAFSFLVTVCWIDEAASNLVAIFNSGNRKKSAGAKSGGVG